MFRSALRLAIPLTVPLPSLVVEAPPDVLMTRPSGYHNRPSCEASHGCYTPFKVYPRVPRSVRRVIKRRKKLYEVLDHFGNALAIVETVARALEAAENDQKCSAVGAEIATLRQAVMAFRAGPPGTRPIYSAGDAMRAVDHRSVSLAFGAVLRIARTHAKLSQEDVAERADLDRTMPSLYERGLRQPTIGTLIALARALGCDPSALLQLTVARLREARP